MIENFFQTTAIPSNQMVGTYDIPLVILSYVVATCASYIALDITGRLRDVGNTQQSTFLWLLGGAFAMGAGIWSMHFIGMLAFSMPMMMNYDFFWTGLSLLVAILASGFALYLLKSRVINLITYIIGGVILGFGIASMHYTGMEAMKINMNVRYLPSYFLLSIIIAIAASEAALWLALKSNSVESRLRIRLKAVSALIMGAAICGMHYTGMIAAVFTPLSSVSVNSVSAIDPNRMAIGIAAVTFIILGIAFFVSAYKDALNQQLLERAREAGMADVAASVLHNVGNVLNSVNVSANVVFEKIGSSKLSGLQDIRDLINQHKDDFVKFIAEDPRGVNVPNFINLLAEYWQNEQRLIISEMNTLIKNLHHIKEIISTQQNLNKISKQEQIVTIDTLIEEAILITGIDNSEKQIVIEKKYEKLKPMLLDKVRLMQILINLLRNAKEALNTVSKQTKSIVIELGLLENHRYFYIQITDTGSGILAEHLPQLFRYGFTTKESGHGFGLHSCALTAKEMGGSIEVKSDGLNQGASFKLILPYKLPWKSLP